MEMLYGTIETPDGSILRIDTRVLASRQEMRSHGDVVDGKMRLILDGSGQPQEALIPWEPDVRGPYGAELSLSRKMMKPGETRDVKIFLPEVNRDLPRQDGGEAGRDRPARRRGQDGPPPGRAGRSPSTASRCRARVRSIGSTRAARSSATRSTSSAGWRPTERPPRRR